MLANVDDVKRVLKLSATTPAEDVEITKALQAAEDWVVARLQYDPGEAGAIVHTFWNVRENESLDLPARGATVTAVRVYDAAGSVGHNLLSTAYTVEEGRRVRLRPSFLVEPFEGAFAFRSAGMYTKVEVTFTPDGIVRASIREGVAWLAAGVWRQSPSAAQGLQSESLGDYSYSLASAQNSKHPAFVNAMNWLRPHISRRIGVT